jgi:hypothetical protein
VAASRRAGRDEVQRLQDEVDELFRLVGLDRCEDE